MKIKWGLKVQDARGKIRRIIAIHTRAGHNLWFNRKTKDWNTEAQRKERAKFLSLSRLWASSTMAPYRDAWKALAFNNHEHNIFDAEIYKTGLQWFMRANRNRQLIGEAVILDAPAYAPVGHTGYLTLSHVHGPPAYLYIIPTDAPAETDAVIIYAAKPLSPGKLTLSNQQRLLTYVNPSTPGLWDIIVEYILKFGTPPTGKKIFVRVWYMDIAQGRCGEKHDAWDYW